MIFVPDNNPSPSLHNRVQLIVGELLAIDPTARSVDLIEQLDSDYGLSVSKATLSQVRQELGMPSEKYPPRKGG